MHDAAELTSEPRYSTVSAILNDWANAERKINAVVQKPAREGRPLKEVSLLTPMPEARAIFCAGANYTDHVEEMRVALGLEPEPDPKSIGLKPWHFIKTYHTVRGPGETIKLPAFSRTVDWEVELVAVIGKTASNVPAERALEYVAGYTAANDLSARDAGKRPGVPDGSPFQYDWVSHKSFEGACPIGPWIVPASAIRDPQNLAIKLWVNDVLKQDSNTKFMIYSAAEQIAQLSTRVTLQPGDIVLTGTPAGVGAARPEFLKAGDTVRIEIEGIGDLINGLV
jgi:2-keto-4-pentenoate hydratase/2-oxohepta-3-ene-1,7-dioic acid hydratase in catechol pathway